MCIYMYIYIPIYIVYISFYYFFQFVSPLLDALFRCDSVSDNFFQNYSMHMDVGMCMSLTRCV